MRKTIGNGEMSQRAIGAGKEGAGRLLCAELPAAGVVEFVLIIAVVVGLVILFKTQITSLLTTIFGQIENAAQGVF